MSNEIIGHELKEFMRGYNDCKEGLKHAASNGDEYDRGYNHRYQLEQIAGAKS